MQNMYKKIALTVFGFGMLFLCKPVLASVIINEVVLYPTAERFVELYNDADAEADLTEWYLQRKTETGDSFGTLVSKTNFENKKIGAKSYFLISRTAMDGADIVLDNLTLTESNTIQLKNKDGEVVDIICWGNVACDISLSSNPKESESIKRSGNTLVLSTPTPDKANETETKEEDSKDETKGDTTISSGGTQASSSGSSANISQNSKEQKIKVEIVSKSKNIFTGMPIELRSVVTDVDTRAQFFGKYFWNFGDGDSKEMRSVENKAVHTFFYEGEYTVSLEYYRNFYSEVPDAVDILILKVVNPNIVISRVGDEADFFIEITNNTSTEADLSGWVLAGSSKSFIFPKNTKIASKKKIILSPKITGLLVLEKENLRLLSPQGDIVFALPPDYLPAETVQIEKEEVRVVSEKINKKSVTIANVIETKKEIGIETENVAESFDNEIALEAQVVSTLPEGESEKDKVKTEYAVAGFAFVLSVGAGAGYVIRKKGRVLQKANESDGFEILE